MSQSPTEDFTSTSLIPYRQGWQALNRLLHEDRSFSGREKNCAFLNARNGTFADVSAVTAFDFPDDGRAVATCDWDFDGKLDLWLTNRNAPRVRLLRNQGGNENSFIALKLEGNGRTTNRDAIGARVQLQWPGEQNASIRTLHAGDGFLSQSSSWLHFGVEKDSTEGEAATAIVHWPGGESETFSGIASGHFYVLSQGSGSPRTWEPPMPKIDFKNAPSTLPPSSSIARIVLTAPLPLPQLEAFNENGKATPLDIDQEGPVLLNVWTTQCASCVTELKEWTQRSEDLRAAGFTVIALNADEPDEDQPLPGRDILRKIRFPFKVENIPAISVRSLDLLQRALLDRWETLPVPSSFLIAEGHVVAIYKGSVSVDQLLKDRSLLTASPLERRAAATPFRGQWIHDPPEADPIRVTSQFIDHAEIERGVDYLKQALALAEDEHKTASSGAQHARQQNLADLYLVLASLLREQNFPEKALQAYRDALSYNPRDYRVRIDLAEFLEQLGELPAAMPELEEALRINPGDPEVSRRLGIALLRLRRPIEALPHIELALKAAPSDAALHFHRATALQGADRMPEAIVAYQDCLNANPNLVIAANNLAWILATHPDASLRNGIKSHQLAKQICEQTRHQEPNFLTTLAASQAEVGDFAGAIKTTEAAIELLQIRPDSAERLASLRDRITLFQSGKPFRAGP